MYVCNGHLDIGFVALSRNGLWCINCLLIFGHSGENPRYGKNARLLQAFTAGPRHVKLTGGHLVTVPRPTLLQRHVGLLLAGDDDPQGPGRGQEEAQGVGAHHVCAFAAWVLRHALIGMAVTASHCHGPAVFIRLHNGVGRPRHSGTEKGFQGLETPQSFFAGGFCAVFTVRPPDPHDP